MAELELSADGTKDFAVVADELMDAIDLASDQDQMTWLVSDGKRIAAIVPVDVAEAHERDIADVLATPVASTARREEILRRFAPPQPSLWPCGCLRNDAGAHRVGCPDYPEGRRG